MLLKKEVIEVIRETSRGIAERYAIEIEGLGMDEDHIHLLCSAHPKMSAGETKCFPQNLDIFQNFR
jgi:putative transposase